MKVIRKTITDNELSVDIDLFEGVTLKESVKKKIREEVGDFLVEQTLVSMNEKKSPVKGAPNYPALSPKYKKRKLEEVGSGEANLEYDGIMKDETAYVDHEDGISIGVFGERAGAADGHNNLSGNSKLKLRQFIPDVGQEYKEPIKREVKRIIADVIAENTKFSKKTFKDIITKTEMYTALSQIFGPLPRPELALAVYRSEELTDILRELDLLRLL